MTASQAGDLVARDELVDRFQPLIRSLCRGRPDYEDHYQEAVCQFLELVHEFDQTSGVYFGYYIKLKLAWRMRNHRRLIRRLTWPEMPMPDPDEIVAPRLDAEERIDLRVALGHLSARQRDVVIRSYWQDQESEPIARDLGVSPRAVRALRLRAERRLAEILTLAAERKAG